MYIDEKLIKILEPHRGETIDVSYAISLIKTIAKEHETEQCDIPIVRDSLNFGFCKYPQDVCDTQCQDCKAEEMWGNKNLH